MVKIDANVMRQYFGVVEKHAV